MADAANTLLLAVVYPAWVLAGLADWACHRASGIARTSGLRENAFHWLMFGQMGVAVVLALALAPTAALVLVLALLWAIHELTVWLELRDTVPRRQVRPIEQMVHSLLEILPLAGITLLAAAHWERMGDWSLRLREQPLPVAVLAGVLGASLLLNGLPLAEETRRCLHARRAGT